MSFFADCLRIDVRRAADVDFDSDAPIPPLMLPTPSTSAAFQAASSAMLCDAVSAIAKHARPYRARASTLPMFLVTAIRWSAAF